METYFFVPASRPEFLEKIKDLSADYFVLDLEDSVSKEERKEAIDNIIEVPNKENLIIRIFWDTASKYRPEKLVKLFKKNGFQSFLIPKITDGSQLELLIDNVNGVDDIELNILVENPTCLASLYKILSTYKIERTFFGSYDYCSALAIKHTYENYEWPKSYMLHISNGFNTKAIDVAHLNLSEEKSFVKDSRRAFQIGFDGKVIIHPKQLDILNSSTLYEKEDLKVALHLKKIIEQKGNVPAIISYEGSYYETTHLGYFDKILKLAGHEKINNG